MNLLSMRFTPQFMIKATMEAVSASPQEGPRDDLPQDTPEMSRSTFHALYRLRSRLVDDLKLYTKIAFEMPEPLPSQEIFHAVWGIDNRISSSRYKSIFEALRRPLSHLEALDRVDQWDPDPNWDVESDQSHDGESGLESFTYTYQPNPAVEELTSDGSSLSEDEEAAVEEEARRLTSERHVSIESQLSQSEATHRRWTDTNIEVWRRTQGNWKLVEQIPIPDQHPTEKTTAPENPANPER